MSKFSKNKVLVQYGLYVLRSTQDIKETFEVLKLANFNEKRWGMFCGEAAVGDFLAMLQVAVETCPNGLLPFLRGVVEALRKLSAPGAQELAKDMEKFITSLKDDPPDAAPDSAAVQAAAAATAALLAKLQKGN
jgi:hypothetical protein